MSATSGEPSVTIVDLETSLLPLLDSIANLAVDPPSLYIDLEGTALGRHGSISIFSLYIAPTKKTYLIDIHSLGNSAFSTTNHSGTSLKTILESSAIPKVIFDIRDHSDALFSLFQISVDGIKDLQLMELALRAGSRNLLSDLTKCIEKDSPISVSAKNEWCLIREYGHRLFDPAKGGRYEVFNERPLNPDISQYCQQGVAMLPGLYGVYYTKLRSPGEAFWRVTIRESTKDRIKLSQSPGYNGNSKSKTLGWDDQAIEEATDSWNEAIMVEAMAGTYVLNEDDEWVASSIDDDIDYFIDEEEEEEEEDNWYEDTARDCIGWEEDMIKNGEYF